MNVQATIGHNNPPDPIEEVIQEFGAVISEAQNWTDGETVDDEQSMLAVDSIIKEFKTYKTALGRAGKKRTDPLHKSWKAEVAAVKIYVDDAELILSSLVGVVAPFKQKLADEKKAKERAAWQAADKARREAEAKAAAANVADLDARREAQNAAQAAIDAQKIAAAQTKDKVKGMRTVTRFEITDLRALVNWIAANDKDAMADFATEYARKNHKKEALGGVRTWIEKEAF